MTFAKRFIACSVCTVDLASTIGCNAVQRDYRTLYARFFGLSTKKRIFLLKIFLLPVYKNYEDLSNDKQR